MRKRRFFAAAGMGLIGLIGLIGPISPIRAAADDPRQSAARQEEIRGQTEQVGSRLDDFIDEYTRNGLAKGDDFETLRKVRSELGSLTGDEMEKVVALLTPPATGGNLPVRQLAEAYTDQKDISVRLKRILAAHERQLDVDALAGAVRQLADRQSANLGTAIDAKQLAVQDKSANGHAAVAASEQAQQGEQGAIAAEVILAADKLARIAADSADPNYQAAATRLGQAQPQAAAAADALGGGKVDDAVNAETAVRAQLEDIARSLAPANKQENMANDAAAQLADIARDQRTLLDQTKRLAGGLQNIAKAQTPEAADKAMLAQFARGAPALKQQLMADGLTPASPADQIRNSPEMHDFLTKRSDGLKQQEETLRPQLAALAATQAALAAKAQMVREDLEKTAKQAGPSMTNALTEMNSAQDSLAQDDGEQAAENETDAANQLGQAAKIAAQGAADAAQAQPAASPAQQLQQLQAGVNDLTAKETTAVQQGDAEKTGPAAAAAAVLQANLAARAEALQQAAAQQDSPAAQPLRQAADAIQNAAQAMQTGGMPQAAQAAQQAALQNLAQAGRQLAQQAAAVTQQKQDLANMERQMDGVNRLLHQQNQLDADTFKAANTGNTGRAKGLARQQENIQRDAENLRQAATAGTPDAAKALDEAGAAMGDAAQKLSDGGGAEAQPPQQDAVAGLYKAQDALADRIQKLAGDLGQPQPAAQELANVEAQLAKAEQQTAAAQQTMAPGHNNADAVMKHAAGQLGQASRTVVQAGEHPEAMTQAARDAVRAAEQALGGAAVAAASGKEQAAQGQAVQGRQDVQAAQAALQQAAAGIADLSPASGRDDQTTAQNSQPSPQSQQAQPAAGENSKGANEKTWSDQAGAVTGALDSAHGTGQYLALPERDRAAVQQSQSEKYPQEYGSMIEAYMRSLSSDAGAK